MADIVQVGGCCLYQLSWLIRPCCARHIVDCSMRQWHAVSKASTLCCVANPFGPACVRVWALRGQCSDAVARRHWTFWYDWSRHNCMHGNVCARKKRGEPCDYGMRIKQAHFITGMSPLEDNPATQLAGSCSFSCRSSSMTGLHGSLTRGLGLACCIFLLCTRVVLALWSNVCTLVVPSWG